MRKHPNATGRILDAAERLFAEKGYEGTSISTIAKVSHVSKANVFHHFGSKEGLYQAVLGRLAHHRIELLKTICPADAADSCDDTGPAGLERFLRVVYQDMHDHPDRERLFLRELIDADSERLGLLARAIEEGLLYESEQVRAAQQKGLLRDDLDPLMLPLLIHGAHILHYMVRPLMLNLSATVGIIEPDDYLHMLARILYSGLRVPNDKDKESAA